MRVYLAGTSVANPKKEKTLCSLFKKGHKLHSYYHIPLFEKHWWKMNKENKVDLFLDSGAFSAWSQEAPIDIEEYIQFIKKNEKVIDQYANLDVIGSAKGTWKNQKIMEKAGLNPLPTFHYGEDIKWLEKYIDKYEYICLGGMVPVSTKDLISWLDVLFANHICDENGIPKVKVHGFGLTSLRLMQRYPWFSVDSTSWVVTGRMGSVYIPKKRNGEWVYNEDSWKIAVSNQSPGKKEAGKHITTLTPTEKKIMLEYVHEKGYQLGESEFRKVPQDYSLKENEKWAEKKPKDKEAERLIETILVDGISNRYQLRDELNIIYFLDLEKSLPEWPWAFTLEQGQKGFFD